MKKILWLLLIGIAKQAGAQELFAYTDAASNIPAHAISIKAAANYITSQPPYNRFMQRYSTEVGLGLGKKFMLRPGITFANMHTHRFKAEAVYLYGKYRFLSQDAVHSHFRMAVFAEAAYNRSPFHFDETNLQGDKSGVQLGVVATQLSNRFALSGTVSHTQVLDASRWDKVAVYIPGRIYQAVNYSISGGLLLLPLEYKSYKQTNLNLYAELLGQQALDRKSQYLDLGTAVQLIFNSNTRMNIGYRFQLTSTMQRMAANSFNLSVERTLLK